MDESLDNLAKENLTASKDAQDAALSALSMVNINPEASADVSMYKFAWELDRTMIASESFMLPNDENITQIGNYAFGGQLSIDGSNIKNITIPGNIKTIGAHAFSYICTFLNNLTIEEGVESIGDAAFVNCGLGSSNGCTLTIPSTLKTIGEYAFENNNILNITLPASLESIGEGAFSQSCATKVTTPLGMKATNISKMFCMNEGHIEHIEINEPVEAVEAEAFNSCENLKTLKLPSTIEVLGNDAFANCSETANVTFSMDYDTFVARFVTTNTDNPKGQHLRDAGFPPELKIKGSNWTYTVPYGKTNEVKFLQIVNAKTLTEGTISSNGGLIVRGLNLDVGDEDHDGVGWSLIRNKQGIALTVSKKQLSDIGYWQYLLYHDQFFETNDEVYLQLTYRDKNYPTYIFSVMSERLPIDD